MRIRPAYLLLAPFGVLLVGALFVILSAHSAGAAELASPESNLARVLNNVVPTDTGVLAPIAPPDSAAPSLPTPAPEQSLPTVLKDSVNTVGAPAADAIQTPLTDPVAQVLDTVSQPPAPGATVGGLVDVLGSVVQGVDGPTPLDPVLDERPPLNELPPLSGVSPSALAPMAHVLPILDQPGATPVRVTPSSPPTVDAVSPLLGYASVSLNVPRDGRPVSRPSLQAPSRDPTKARAEPADGLPAGSDPPIWYRLVEGLAGATSAQTAQRAGTGLVLAVLITAVSLVARRRRFMLRATVPQAQGFASLVARPG